MEWERNITSDENGEDEGIAQTNDTAKVSDSMTKQLEVIRAYAAP